MVPVEANSVLDGYYDLYDTIGQGSFAKVKLGVHRLTGEKVAIKIMDKKRPTVAEMLPQIRREIEAMKALSHQNVCKLFQVIETETQIYLVLEYCPGGDLFDYIDERGRLAEGEARHLFRQIVAAVAQVHDQGFAHRDLKLENLLLGEDKRLKLTDFGLCAKPKGGMGSHLDTFCGTVNYAAPEIISGKRYLGSEADVWSMGVLLYTLLCGCLPFCDDNIGMLHKKMQSGMYEKPEWLSEVSIEMLDQLLQADPERRITVTQLLNHPWVLQDCRPDYLVEWEKSFQMQELDDECVAETAVSVGQSTEAMNSCLSAWQYDYNTATYLLLRQRKQRSQTLKSLSDIQSVPGTTAAAQNRPLEENDVEHIFAEPLVPTLRESKKQSPSITDCQIAPSCLKVSALDNISKTPVSCPTSNDQSPWVDAHDRSNGAKKSTRKLLARIERALERVRSFLSSGLRQHKRHKNPGWAEWAEWAESAESDWTLDELADCAELSKYALRAEKAIKAKRKTASTRIRRLFKMG